MARQITVTNKAYDPLLGRKGHRSFSQAIKKCLRPKKEKTDIMSLAGILKNDEANLQKLKTQITAEREGNHGRT